MMIFRLTEHVPDNVLAKAREQLAKRFGDDAILLSHHVELVHTAPPIPDAICRFCAVANLTSSIWCVACGAPLYRA